MPTLDGNDIGKITGESGDLDTGSDEYASPLSGPEYTIVTMMSGAIKHVSISGTYTDTSIANAQTNFIDVIEAIANGAQLSPVEYVSASGKTYLVYIKRFRYNMTAGYQTIVNYSIELVQGL